MELKFNATLLAQIFHFLLLLVLLRLVAYKPLMRILEERQKLVADRIAQAEQRQAEAERIKADMEAELRRAREEAQQIIERATKASEQQAQAIMDAAKEEAARLKESAMTDIQREKDKALAELKDQVANLAILVAGKVIREGLTAEAQEKLIQDAISEVKNLPC
ncbi:F0F1 ATP synthase subunit B [Thermodesulfitimonas autotrophica]|uniref:ATP synthase subunit b n=1 Tax=Thermodesulfitimonas autotrophica TaxID=1894989 RepID=A0A3N5AGJ3_9THEO|nr:F0F1 ATP synthase subunit B [Thermodesulfitimonas autotrophica]RPF42970.1 ATP synthase F0 subcomplex B subunit [Thermodesulfitimonas autotrophica]